MNKTHGGSCNFLEKLYKFDTSSEGDKLTLFSLSSNIMKDSNLEDSGDALPWSSSIDSLNQLSSDQSKNSLRRDDQSMHNDLIEEEEKDEDFERDLSMDVDSLSCISSSKPILRKRMSCHKLEEDEDLERIVNEQEDYLHPQDEDFLELKRSDMLCLPKSLSKLKKMRSAVYEEESMINSA